MSQSQALYLAMAGAKQTMLAQSVSANNLANISTPGFREDLYSANRVTLTGREVPLDVYPVEEKSVPNFTPGLIKTTGRDLDVAINGQGWIAVQSATGAEAYTRAGSFYINEAGQLMTETGQAVIGDSGAISIPPAESLNIAKDGTITIRPTGQPATALAVIGRIKLVKPDNEKMQKGNDTLFYSKDGTAFPASTDVTLESGALESSNVNGVDAMINIISLARQFEMQVKMMQEISSNEQTVAHVLQD